jgi:hypothetical protein
MADFFICIVTTDVSMMLMHVLAFYRYWRISIGGSVRQLSDSIGSFFVRFCSLCYICAAFSSCFHVLASLTEAAATDGREDARRRTD